jgi:hypothetical protein
VPDLPLKIHQAYIVQSSLLYFPAFLEDPKALLEPLRFLAQGDMRALRERKELKAVRRRIQGRPHGKSPFIRFIGPILNPLAKYRARSVDDEAPWRNVWSIPTIQAPHTQRGHLPYLVPANWSLRLVEPAASWPRFHLRPRLKLHVFPYGLIDILLCTEFSSQQGLDVSQFVPLVNGLSHVRSTRELDVAFEVTNAKLSFQRNALGIMQEVGSTLQEKLFNKGNQPLHRQDAQDAPLAVVLFLNRIDPSLMPADHAAQICGLVTGDEHWKRLAPDYVEPYAERDYGKYQGDFIKLGRLQSVVSIAEPRHRGGRRLLYWKMLSRIQLARVEAFLFSLYTNRLKEIWCQAQQDNQRAWEAFKHWVSMKDDYMPQTSLFFFWDDLVGFSRQPLGGHSKVYERAAELAGVEERKKAFAEELSAFMKYGLQTEPRLLTAWKRLSPLYSLVEPFLKGGAT